MQLPNIIYTEIEVYDNESKKICKDMSYMPAVFYHVLNEDDLEKANTEIKSEIKSFLSDKFSKFKKYKENQLLMVSKSGKKYLGKVNRVIYIDEQGDL